MNFAIFLSAGALLGIERIAYIAVWRAPDHFRSLCARFMPALVRQPVEALRLFFYGFKILQGAVFLGWCYLHGGSLWPGSAGLFAAALGTGLILAGQALNAGVFYRLGKLGVFYGNKFGYEIPWQRGFPFSLLKHPQYTGAVLTIWGFFLIMRFPSADWYALPLLETLYYILGAHLESDAPIRAWYRRSVTDSRDDIPDDEAVPVGYKLRSRLRY
ncbi:MAG TPA: methyltransferase [Candidatus Binatia bacterium]|nr:methyltransferase [Candidatus Binatia bacterium]